MNTNDHQGVKDESVVPPTPDTQEPQSAPEAQPAPAPAEAPSKDGGVTPDGKVYTEAEVNAILHERTKGYSEMRKQYEAYRSFGSVDELNQKLKGPAAQASAQPPAEQLDEDDKKFLGYLKKLVPGLDSLSSLKELSPEKIAFLNEMREKEVASRESYVNTAEQEIMSHCTSLNIKDEARVGMVRDMVAAIILNSPELSARWRANDPSVVSEAIKTMNATLGAGVQKPSLADQQAQAAVKAKAALVKPPLPPGGVAAPITKDRKLNDEERLDAAWRRIQQSQ